MTCSRRPEPQPALLREIAFDRYDPADEGRRESLLALGNGVLFSRASAIDACGDDVHYPGTYQAGCYATLVGETEGQRVAIESLVKLPNWLPLIFRIDQDAWFSLDRSLIHSYRQALDLTCGILRRSVNCSDQAGRRMQLTETRLVSMADPRLAGVRLEMIPLGWSGNIEVRAGLDGEVTNARVAPHDGYERTTFDVQAVNHIEPDSLLLSARTRRSNMTIGLSARVQIDDLLLAPQHVEKSANRIDAFFRCAATDGRMMSIEKVVGLTTSLDEPDPAGAALAAIQTVENFPALELAHKAAWKAVWLGCRLEAGRNDLAQALSFHAFSILQTASPLGTGRDVGLPSRGWQEAYHGHVFWDEILVLPFLNVRFPEVARSKLLYRHRRLDAAQRAAKRLGFRGAMFPWRSAATGEEVTPSFQRNDLTNGWMPDHTHLQRHIGAAIAWNVWHHVLATGDTAFLANEGGELLVEIARFWASAAQRNERTGRYDICGVMGPDEFHTAYPGAKMPGLRNSGYTNVMAAWTLLRAGEALDLLPAAAREKLVQRLAISSDEPAQWAQIACRLALPIGKNGGISQFDGFESLAEIDIDQLSKSDPDHQINQILDAEGKDINAYKVLKQADMAMLLYLMPLAELRSLLEKMGYAQTATTLRRTIEDDFERTVHDSSLSRVIYSGAFAQLDRERSWQLYEGALYPDQQEGSSSTEKGLHLGAMAATLDVLQRVYLGIQPGWNALSINPSPPPALGPASLGIRYRAADLTVSLSGSVLEVRSDPANVVTIRVENKGQIQTVAPGCCLQFAV